MIVRDSSFPPGDDSGASVCELRADRDRELEARAVKLAHRTPARAGLGRRPHRLSLHKRCHSPGTPLSVCSPRSAQRDAGARHQILDRSGNENLARSRERCDSGANVHCYTADLVFHELALSGVKSYLGPEGRSRGRYPGSHMRSGSHAPARQGREEAVSCRYLFPCPGSTPTVSGSSRGV